MSSGTGRDDELAVKSREISVSDGYVTGEFC
jgi:hypothetical protein